MYKAVVLTRVKATMAKHTSSCVTAPSARNHSMTSCATYTTSLSPPLHRVNGLKHDGSLLLSQVFFQACGNLIPNFVRQIFDKDVLILCIRVLISGIELIYKLPDDDWEI